MDQLQEKINAYTKDGAPGVSQLIELQELAKKNNVSKTALEKLIQDRLNAHSEVKEETISEEENDSFNEYQRPDFDSIRSSFDKEMESRREEFSYNQPEDIQPEGIKIEQPKVEFPEIDVTFNNETPEINTTIEPLPEVKGFDIPNIDSITSENVEEIKVNDEFETISLEDEVEIESSKEQLLDDSLKTYLGLANQQDSIEELDNLLYYVNNNIKKFGTETDLSKRVKSEIKHRILELRQKTVKKTSSDQQFTNALYQLRDQIPNLKTEEEVIRVINTLRKLVDKYDIKSDLSEQLERELTNKRISLREPAFSKEKVEEARKIFEDKKQKIREYKDPPPKVSHVTDTKEIQTSFMISIISLITSIIFGMIGGLIAIFALSRVSNVSKMVERHPMEYSKKDRDKIKSARMMALIGLIIGLIRLGSFIYYRYYWYGYYY